MRPIPGPAAFPIHAKLSLAALFLAAGTWAGPETLTFVVGNAETLQVRIDYDRHPDIAPTDDRTWEERQKDSVYKTGAGDEETLNVRYAKAFYAELNGLKGVGSDYIFYTGPSEPRAGWEPTYTAECIFSFPNGSASDELSNITVHLNDFPRLHPAYGGGVPIGMEFGFTPAGGTTSVAKLVARKAGWDVPVAARPSEGRNPRPGTAGWVVRLDGNQVLRVPEGRSRVRLFDVTGRSAWHAHGLRPGTDLALPAQLGQGAFRFQWIP